MGLHQWFRVNEHKNISKLGEDRVGYCIAVDHLFNKTKESLVGDFRPMLAERQMV